MSKTLSSNDTKLKINALKEFLEVFLLSNSNVSLEDTQELLTSIISKNPSKKKTSSPNVGILKFTKSEIKKMPDNVKIFFYNNLKIKYRYHNGVYQARIQILGESISVAHKNLETMKKKFVHRLNLFLMDKPQSYYFELSKRCEGFDFSPSFISSTAQMVTTFQNNAQPNESNLPFRMNEQRYTPNTKTNIKFEEVAKQWLQIKQETTKPSTFKEYSRTVEKDILPIFGHLPISTITRQQIQDFLFSYTKQNKYRTAEKLKLSLSCIYDIIETDYGLKNFVKQIELPFYESKKGKAFTISEEKQLVDYCIKNRTNATSSAILVLLYFGLRRSELKSIKVLDYGIECETSKERMGRNVVKRIIPFTPMFKKIMQYVDFNKARDCNLNALHSAIKRLFPNHHTHELRYTFITRCKECGVNPEVVMLWDGHSQDKDVKSSLIDRGYTDYSQDYLLAQAELVNYDF